MKIVNSLLDFIDNSPTAYHVVSNTKKVLDDNNFVELKKNEPWKLDDGKKYYIVNEESALMAFTLNDIKRGFNIVSAHTDSPLIKIKPNPVVITDNHYVSLNIDVYGGPIITTWFDRGLSIAGKVVVRENGKVVSKLIDCKKTLLTIPSVAIHLVRDKDASEINRQNHLKPVISFVSENLEKDDYLYKVITKELNCEKSDIIDFDLYVYDNQKGEVFGLNDEFVHSKYLDDLLMAHSGLMALLESNNNKSKVLMLTDNEEIGSGTATGAQSAFFENMLERVFLNMNLTREDMFMSFAKSYALSGDLAHGYHPNYKEKYDETNKPMLGKGLVIKFSANKSYSTESFYSSVFKNELEKRGTIYQNYVNRSDIKGGGTIGPMISRKFGISAVDCGPAIFAMHSVRECASSFDIQNTFDALTCFFEIGE